MATPARIRKLDKTVVNRIAAGEVAALDCSSLEQHMADPMACRSFSALPMPSKRCLRTGEGSIDDSMLLY